ncbi:hypothetical protein [Micromonospora sp. DT47]|uniref:hypothetical protein n=1 Tax=Micromonospora sp. DT47 TaxID=3393431 RepID=UPI003CF32B1E
MLLDDVLKLVTPALADLDVQRHRQMLVVPGERGDRVLIDFQRSGATGALEITDGGNGGEDPDDGCGNDPRKLVEDTAKEVVEEWGLSGLDKRITSAKWEHPEYTWAYRGSEVHKETARRLGQRYPELFDAKMRGKGPDFPVKGTDKLVELTTPGEVAKHKAKGRKVLVLRLCPL